MRGVSPAKLGDGGSATIYRLPPASLRSSTPLASAGGKKGPPFPAGLML